MFHLSYDIVEFLSPRIAALVPSTRLDTNVMPLLIFLLDITISLVGIVLISNPMGLLISLRA